MITYNRQLQAFRVECAHCDAVCYIQAHFREDATHRLLVAGWAFVEIGTEIKLEYCPKCRASLTVEVGPCS